MGKNLGLLVLKLKENNLNPIEACLSYPMSLADVDKL